MRVKNIKDLKSITLLAIVFCVIYTSRNINDVIIRMVSDVKNVIVMTSPTHKSISLSNNICNNYLQNGTFFGVGKESTPENRVDLCFLLSLSESVKNEIPGGSLCGMVRIKSPSVLRHKGSIYVTFRVRFRGSPTCRGHNYLYMKKFNVNFTSSEKGGFVNIPTPLKNPKVNGAHDARLFQLNGDLFAVLSISDAPNWIAQVWDFHKKLGYTPKFEKELKEKGKSVKEKNWVPLLVKNTLHIIRHLDPMHVLKCPTLDSCEFLGNETEAMNYHMEDEKVPLRGGTNFEEYKYPYYIGLAHTTTIKQKSRYYNAHLVLISVEPEFRIIYISDPIQVHSNVYSMFRGPKQWSVVEGDFIFPVGVLFEDLDSILVSAHVNDLGSALFRLQGLKPLLEEVIQLDREAAHQKKRAPSDDIQKYMLKRMGLLFSS